MHPIQPQRSYPLKFLKRLLSKPQPKRVFTDRLSGPGAFDIEVGGLSIKNLDVFWKATSNEWRRTDQDRDFYEYRTDATLASDDGNRVPHAIRVEIAGKVVGHLGNSDALRLHRRLKDSEYDGISSVCHARIVGRLGHWEVNIDLDPALLRFQTDR